MGCAPGCLCAPARWSLRPSASLSPATGLGDGDLRAPRGQPPDPGRVHSAHARSQSISRADLGGEPGTDPRRPAAAKTLARNLERGARFSGSPPAPMPAPLQPCTLGHNADPPLAALAPAAGGERAPLSRSSCTSRAARPPPRRRTAQLRKERRQEIPGSKAPADAPLVPVPFAPSPPPASPASPARGGGGGGARGPALLRQNKARRGSPRPRTEPVTKAGGRRRAPRPRSAGGGREGGLEGGVRCAPAVPGLRHLAALSPVTG